MLAWVIPSHDRGRAKLIGKIFFERNREVSFANPAPLTLQPFLWAAKEGCYFIAFATDSTNAFSSSMRSTSSLSRLTMK